MNKSNTTLRGILLNVCSIIFVSSFFTANTRANEISLIPPDPILTLPKLPSERFSVHEPANKTEMTYHNDPLITKWNGQFFTAWHASMRSERTRPVYGMVAKSSDNGTTWTQAQNFTQTGDSNYEVYMKNRHGIAAEEEVTINTMPWCFNVYDSTLYLFSRAWMQIGSTGYWRGRVHYTQNGTDWIEIDGSTLDSFPDLNIRIHWSNHAFVTLDNGKLIAASYEPAHRAPTTADTSGLSGWTGGNISISLPLADPAVWQGSDGVIHYAAGRIKKFWHAYSSDGGNTWSTMTEQSDFPYNTGESFGTFPDGRNWYLGTPMAYSQRNPLVFGVSSNGWDFTDLYIVRDEMFEQKYPWPYKGSRVGYQNPHAVIDGQVMFIVYSVCRDRIELSRVDISNLFN